jgi:hypothetical protein
VDEFNAKTLALLQQHTTYVKEGVFLQLAVQRTKLNRFADSQPGMDWRNFGVV